MVQFHKCTRCIQKKMSHICFELCRKLTSTYKGSKYDEHTVFLCVPTCGVNFFFYPLSSLHFNSSIFAPTSLFSSFHQERYWCRCRNHNRMSVPLGGTPSPPPPLMTHMIRRAWDASYVYHSLEREGCGIVVWRQPLPFRQGWDTIISF